MPTSACSLNARKRASLSRSAWSPRRRMNAWITEDMAPPRSVLRGLDRAAQPDVVLLHQRLEVGALHAGLLGALRDVPGVALQRLEDEGLLDALDRLLA